VGPRAGLDAVRKRKIPSPRWESNPLPPIVQAVASRYTEICLAPDYLYIFGVSRAISTSKQVGSDACLSRYSAGLWAALSGL
jgi:hypothetical protein